MLRDIHPLQAFGGGGGEVGGGDKRGSGDEREGKLQEKKKKTAPDLRKALRFPFCAGTSPATPLALFVHPLLPSVVDPVPPEDEDEESSASIVPASCGGCGFLENLNPT